MRPSDHSEPPRDQPIAMLPTIAKLIDESLAAAQEQYATLCQARAKPHVLDDATLSRRDLEWIEVYQRQLDRLADGAADRAAAPHNRSPRSTCQKRQQTNGTKPRAVETPARGPHTRDFAMVCK